MHSSDQQVHINDAHQKLVQTCLLHFFNDTAPSTEQLPCPKIFTTTPTNQTFLNEMPNTYDCNKQYCIYTSKNKCICFEGSKTFSFTIIYDLSNLEGIQNKQRHLEFIQHDICFQRDIDLKQMNFPMMYNDNNGMLQKKNLVYNKDRSPVRITETQDMLTKNISSISILGAPSLYNFNFTFVFLEETKILVIHNLSAFVYNNKKQTPFDKKYLKENSTITYFELNNNTYKYFTLDTIGWIESDSNSGLTSPSPSPSYTPEVKGPDENGCFTIEQIGGRINHKAKAMCNLPLHISNPDMFIIGKYGYDWRFFPKRPFVVIPIDKHWIKGNSIVFPVANKKTITLTRYGNRLHTQTGKTQDIFSIKTQNGGNGDGIYVLQKTGNKFCPLQSGTLVYMDGKWQLQE